MKRLLLVGVFAISCTNAAPATTPTVLTKARYLQCPSHSLGAELELVPGATDYAGHGRDNYQDTKWDSCRSSPTEIRCSGTWNHDGRPSQLVITTLQDGSFKATMQGPYDMHEMPCVARDTPLSHDCVFNPGTPTCKVAP